MVSNHELDTKFAFLSHLVQELKPINLIYGSQYCGGHVVAAILDFMKTSNTNNVCLYIIDQPVKFRGNIPQFKILPYSPPLLLIGANI